MFLDGYLARYRGELVITVFHASFVACKSPVPWPRIICTLCARHSATLSMTTASSFRPMCIHMCRECACTHGPALERENSPSSTVPGSLSVRESSIDVVSRTNDHSGFRIDARRRGADENCADLARGFNVTIFR
ncbi:hypothetical protein ANTPLA_LOCUS2271 [Anthophora plagiata]